MIGLLAGTLAVVLGVVGQVLMVTGLVGFCPIYRVFGVSTCPTPRR